MHFISLCSHQISKQYIFSGHVLLLLTAASVIRILLYLYGPLSQMHCRCSSIFCLLSLLKFKMDSTNWHLRTKNGSYFPLAVKNETSDWPKEDYALLLVLGTWNTWLLLNSNLFELRLLYYLETNSGALWWHKYLE